MRWGWISANGTCCLQKVKGRVIRKELKFRSGGGNRTAKGGKCYRVSCTFKIGVITQETIAVNRGRNYKWENKHGKSNKKRSFSTVKWAQRNWVG